MKKLILYVLLLVLMLFYDAADAQQFLSKRSTAKKVVTIPVIPDSSESDNFCICKIVTYKSDNLEIRTDAIFAGSTPEQKLFKKELLRNIDFELQQALIFFDSYKLEGQYAAPVGCNTMYRYLRKEHEGINKYTVLLPSYASRF